MAVIYRFAMTGDERKKIEQLLKHLLRKIQNPNQGERLTENRKDSKKSTPNRR